VALLKKPLVLLKSDKTPVAVLKTRRRILIASSKVVKRLETSAGVPDPGGAADEYPNTFPIVGAGYGAVRVGTHRLRF